MTPQTATDTRDRILEAAMGLFHARSFDGVGTDEICRAAEVNKGSLYHHFPSKAELAEAAAGPLVADKGVVALIGERITAALNDPSLGTIVDVSVGDGTIALGVSP